MRLWVAALPCLIPAVLVAQPRDSTRTGHWTANAELSFADMAGNKSLSLLTTGISAKRLEDRHYELALSGSAQYGRSNGDVAVATFQGEFNLRFRPMHRVSPFVRTTAMHDGIRNIDVRMAMAAGGEFNAIADGPSTVTLGLALLQDYESRNLPEGSTDDPVVSSTRFNLQFRGATPLRPGVTVAHSSQWEPVAGRFSDYLLMSKTSIQVVLTDALAFQTSYTFNRDVSPPPGVEFRNDRTLTTGLVVRFK